MSTPSLRLQVDVGRRLDLVRRRCAGVVGGCGAERVTRRRVTAGQDRDGLGFLSGLDLPLEDVVAADGYVDQLARQLKHRGDPRTLACLRADVFTALLTGQTAADMLDTHAGEDTADEAGDPPTSQTTAQPGVAYANRQIEYPSAAELVRYGDADPAEQAAVETVAARLTADWQAGSGRQLADTVDPPTQLEVRDRHAYPDESDGRDTGVADEQATVVHLCDWRDTASSRSRHRYYPTPWPTSPGQAQIAQVIQPAESGAAAAPRLVSWIGRPLVELVLPYDLRCGGSTPGEANGWGLIPADIARRLLTQAATAPSDWCLTTVDHTGRVITHSPHPPRPDRRAETLRPRPRPDVYLSRLPA